MLSELERAARTFEAQGWVFPAYIEIGFLRRLAVAINEESTGDAKHAVLAGALAIPYGPRPLAAMVLERYRKVPHIADFAGVIEDAIEAFHMGLTRAAVASLVPVVEGVLRKIANAQGAPFANNERIFKKLCATIDALIVEQQQGAPGTTDECVMMLTSLRQFVSDYLFIKTDLYTGTGALNRHGIVHGIFEPAEYGHDYNFYKLLSILDLACFFVSLRTPGCSALAPDETKASQVLAAYYVTLAVIAKQKHDLFAKLA